MKEKQKEQAASETKEPLKEPFSYHTFLFPFLFDNGNRKKSAREDFEKRFLSGANGAPKGGAWEEYSLSAANSDTDLYGQFHYFNGATRHLIYSEKKDDGTSVWNYIFRFDEQDRKDAENPIEYLIEKKDESFVLKVNAVRLKLFATGVGILIFELENYQYFKREEILRINEYGRRIFMPYYSVSDPSAARIDTGGIPSETLDPTGSAKETETKNGSVNCSICADRILLQKKKDGEDPPIPIDGATDIVTPPKSYRDTIPMAPIRYLLPGVKMSYEDRDDGYSIEPIIDDRMFVCCYYPSDELIREAAEWTGDAYRYLTDAEKRRTDDKENTAQKIYELVFIDGNGSSCHNRAMLKKLLEEHVYCRWLEYYYEGSLSSSFIGITEYSMVMVANCPKEYAQIPFLIEYVEMMTIVLAQRASLRAFETKIGKCKTGDVDIKAVHGEYCSFKSTMLLSELTAQQQGIEIYEMMRANLYIETEAESIEGRIKDIYSQNTAKQEKIENGILLSLACLGVFEAIDTFARFIPCSSRWCWLPWLKLGLSAVLIVTAIVLWKKASRK